MPQPIVIAHHLIWTAYGWWLPNDPRGSTSREIRVEKLKDLGPVHYERKPVQPSREELQRFHEEAQDRLAHQVIEFTDEEIELVGKSLGKVIGEEKYTCYRCAIMPEHVHMLMRRHRDKAEVMIEKFQRETREALIQAKRRGLLHPVWGGPGWKVFLDSREAIENVDKYVQENPKNAGRPEQHWSFVTKYDGWVARTRTKQAKLASERET